jgi:hypothetical protein
METRGRYTGVETVVAGNLGRRAARRPGLWLASIDRRSGRPVTPRSLYP